MPSTDGPVENSQSMGDRPLSQGALTEQQSLQSLPPAKPQDFHGRHADGLVIDTSSGTISATDVVEAFGGAITCGGPLLGSDESATSLILTLQEWGFGGPDEAPRRQRSTRYDQAVRNGSSLIQPPGNLEVGGQKFVCIFKIGLEDDEEFALVKRILGKAGNNMRRISDDCNARVRLRGIGSGFLEGANATEADMPLQLNVSCTDYSDYVAAVDQVARLLRDLYKHYRRYARSKQMEPPDVKLCVEEVRRDDLKLNLFAGKDSITAEVEGKRAPLKDAPTSPALRDADKSHVVSHILRSWPNAQSKRKAQSRGS